MYFIIVEIFLFKYDYKDNMGVKKGFCYYLIKII